MPTDWSTFGHMTMALARAEMTHAANWRKWVVPNASLTEIVWDAEIQSGALLRHGDATHLAALAAFEAEP